MKKIVKNLPGLCWIAVGNLIYAVIVVLFVLPGQLISCGTTGLALVAQQLWGIPVSGFVFVFNVAMLLLGLAILGKKFAMTTVLSSLLYPVLLSGVQALLGDFRVTEDLLLCALFGGMGLGIALGIVIRAGASTGGMDIPPLILNKTLTAGTGRTEVKIVSEKAREICESILCNADRGVTLLHGEGGFLHEPTEMVLSVVATRELHRVQNLARAIDPECFMVVTQVTEVSGRGFSFNKVYREKTE